jgi:hypothetical protein
MFRIALLDLETNIEVELEQRKWVFKTKYKI